MKAYQIDAAARLVREVEYSGLPDLNRLVGGYLEVGARFPDGSVLFVDEEFLRKPLAAFFRLGSGAPFGGNGVVVGPEREGPNGEDLGTAPPAFSVEKLAEHVRFLSRAQMDAWVKANASDPAITFTSFGPNGSGSTEVLARLGSLWGGMPKPEPEPEKESG